MKRPLPKIADLKLLLEYYPETGYFTWLPRADYWFSPSKKWTVHQQAKSWNTQHAGKMAGSIQPGDYNRIIVLDSSPLLAHRIAWAMFYGAWPSGHIDHINHDRSDNRIFNLRLVTKADNNRNAKLRYDNTSGVTGIAWQEKIQKWVAIISRNSKSVYLGAFEHRDAAVAARKAAEFEFGYHKNHGR